MKDKDWDMAHDAVTVNSFNEGQVYEICGIEYVDVMTAHGRHIKLKATHDLNNLMADFDLDRKQREELWQLIERYTRDRKDEDQIE